MLLKQRMHSVLAGTVLAGVCSLALAQGPTTRPGARLRFSLAQPDSDKPVTVSISGRVTDAGSGKPIEGAAVRGYIVVWRYRGPDLFDRCPFQQTQTDADGRYRLRFNTLLSTRGPMKGRDGAGVWVSADGYETRPVRVRPGVTAGKTAFEGVDCALRPGRLLQGTVVDEAGRPIAGATVDLQNNLNGTWLYFGCLGRTTTDSDGKFKLWCSTDREVVGGKPWLEVNKPGYGQMRFWDALSIEYSEPLRLPKGGTISGKVVDKNGAPVAGWEVSARGFWNQWSRAVTDEKGQYQLPGIYGRDSQKKFLDEWNKWTNRRDKPYPATVYARPDAKAPLKGALHYKLLAVDGQTIIGPDLVVGAAAMVSGRLLPSQTALQLKGMLVRMDYDWDNMVEADADGRFQFDSVSPGKHRLTAYLPTNLRGDAGIGQAQVTVEVGKSLQDVQIQLRALCEVRVQVLDAGGNPLEGITAGATWSRSGDGFWTEGTVSDKDGKAVLYLYPGRVQYVRGFDSASKLVAEAAEQVTPSAGQVVENVRITMVPAATVAGKILDREGKAVAGQDLLCRVEYADGMVLNRGIKTGESGEFDIKHVQPGVVKVTVRTRSPGLAGQTAEKVELKPGQTRKVEIALAKTRLYNVTGRLAPSPTFQKLHGFKIRLDLGAWQPMVETDENGNFSLKAPAGKHRLTAYLPFNLRTDRGVGHTEIDVVGDTKDVQLPLETLATVNMKIVDESGKPLEGVFAAAFWTEDHSGVFTEGTKSDKDGNATLYVYPGQRQYLAAGDWDRKWQAVKHREVTLKPGEVLNGVVMVMTAAKE